MCVQVSYDGLCQVLEEPNRLDKVRFIQCREITRNPFYTSTLLRKSIQRILCQYPQVVGLTSGARLFLYLREAGQLRKNNIFFELEKKI